MFGLAIAMGSYIHLREQQTITHHGRLTTTVTRDLGFSGLNRRTAPFFASYDTHRGAEDLF
jgi:hypothetical protein